MADVEDIEDPPAFKREDWIGQGKKITDVPIFVLNACTNAFAIPAEYKSHFPSNNITVSELLTWDLPSQSTSQFYEHFMSIFEHFLEARYAVRTKLTQILEARSASGQIWPQTITLRPDFLGWPLTLPSQG